MKGINVSETPGLREAEAQQCLSRDAAFLDDVQDVCGFKLSMMTLRTYLTLRLAGNPLLYGGIIDPPSLAQFLWVLSPGWRPGRKGRASFMRSCRFFVPRGMPLFRFPRLMTWWRLQRLKAWMAARPIIEGCQSYVEETMIDRSAGKSSKGQPIFYSDICFYWMQLNRWGMLKRSGFAAQMEEMLDIPLRILFQILKYARHEAGETVEASALSRKAMERFAIKLNESGRG